MWCCSWCPCGVRMVNTSVALVLWGFGFGGLKVLLLVLCTIFHGF